MTQNARIARTGKNNWEDYRSSPGFIIWFLLVSKSALYAMQKESLLGNFRMPGCLARQNTEVVKCGNDIQAMDFYDKTN